VREELAAGERPEITEHAVPYPPSPVQLSLVPGSPRSDSSLPSWIQSLQK
jgi:hypothetical protein